MQRLSYFIRRLLLMVPTFLGITIICFGLIQLVPGGPVDQAILQMRGMQAGEAATGTDAAVQLTESYRKQLEIRFGFDRPFHERYVKWLVHDRLGMQMPSYKFTNKTTWQLIKERFPVSLAF
ncbi:MAG: peptide ABC transporter permease, partial [Verrucomicrobia bacterium]|nr:peptide ABC transporter permease [Verrucomicrobiota bacterium]